MACLPQTLLFVMVMRGTFGDQPRAKTMRNISEIFNLPGAFPRQIKRKEADDESL